jgi:hypothetical protein
MIILLLNYTASALLLLLLGNKQKTKSSFSFASCCSLHFDMLAAAVVAHLAGACDYTHERCAQLAITKKET